MVNFQKRPYQINAAKALYVSNEPILGVSPGGSGKTIIIALVTRRARRERKRVLILSHRREIILQVAKTVNAAGMTTTILMRNEPYNPAVAVVVASVDTLRRRKLRPNADIVIIDEAHRAMAHHYAELVRYYKQKGAKVIGLSATPYRLDGVGLGNIFATMYEAAKPSQLLGRYIAKPLVFSAPPELLPDLTKARSRKGEYVPDDLVKLMNKRGLIAGISAMAKKHLKGRHAVVFCCSIKHSKAVAADLRKNGFKAEHVDGEFSIEERDAVLTRLRSGKIQILTCCMLLAEGWDFPQCSVVIMARPTRSLSLYIQMANRAARKTKTQSLILDHACNTVLHGFSYIDRDWSLDGRGIADPKKPPELRVCPTCGNINKWTVEVCPICGTELKEERKRSPREQKQHELVEWSKRKRQRR